MGRVGGAWRGLVWGAAPLVRWWPGAWPPSCGLRLPVGARRGPAVCGGGAPRPPAPPQPPGGQRAGPRSRVAGSRLSTQRQLCHVRASRSSSAASRTYGPSGARRMTNSVVDPRNVLFSRAFQARRARTPRAGRIGLLQCTMQSQVLNRFRRYLEPCSRMAPRPPLPSAKSVGSMDATNALEERPIRRPRDAAGRPSDAGEKPAKP